MSIRSPLSSPSLRGIAHSYFPASPTTKHNPTLIYKQGQAAFAHTHPGSPLSGRERDFERDREREYQQDPNIFQHFDHNYSFPTPVQTPNNNNQPQRGRGFIPSEIQIKAKRPPMPPSNYSYSYSRGPGPLNPSSQPRSPGMPSIATQSQQQQIHSSVQSRVRETRRRPSFKIDLPPRPVPSELLSQSPVVNPNPANSNGVTTSGAHHAGGTPYAHPHAKYDRAQVGTPLAGQTPSSPSVANANTNANSDLIRSNKAFDLTELNTGLNAISPSVYEGSPRASSGFAFPRDGRNVGVTTVHQQQYTNYEAAAYAEADADAHNINNNDNYLILRAPTNPLDALYHPSSYPSPSADQAGSHDPYALAGLVGLGYSLNRLRAPTPWIRMEGEDKEWLDARFGACLGKDRSMSQENEQESENEYENENTYARGEHARMEHAEI